MTESLNRIPGKTARWMWKIFTCMNLSHFPLFMCPNCISVSFVLYILRNQPIGWAKRIMNKTVFANSILLVENSVGWMTVNRESERIKGHWNDLQTLMLSEFCLDLLWYWHSVFSILYFCRNKGQLPYFCL